MTAIIAHGGAAKYNDDEKLTCTVAVEKAISIGTALQAVLHTVIELENNSLFNAGYGSCLNEEGHVEMDSMIMDGSTYDYGAVASIDCVNNPVKLAYEVMKNTPHCLIVGEGAKKFAKTTDIPLCDDSLKLITKEQKEIFDKTSNFSEWLKSDMDSESQLNKFKKINDNCHNHDTVGCVAIDLFGNIACATSTGGINRKMLGRVGDSPIIGCGGYANEEGGAVATGHGESFIKLMATKTTVLNLENGDNPFVSCMSVLDKMNKKFKSKGGIITINKNADIGCAYTTEYMPWAAYDKHGNLANSVNKHSPFVFTNYSNLKN